MAMLTMDAYEALAGRVLRVRGITDAGLSFLAALPNLREVALESLPGVTLEGTKVFPAAVRVRYST